MIINCLISIVFAGTTGWYLFKYAEILKEKIIACILLLLVFGSVGWLYVRQGLTIQFYIQAFVLSITAMATGRDIKEKIIPDTIMFPSILLVCFSLLVMPSVNIVSHIITAIVVGGVLFAIHHFSDGALGLGDVKLLTMLALVLEWKAVVVLLLYATAAAGILSIFLLTFKVVNKKSTLPFAPFILFSLIIVMVV